MQYFRYALLMDLADVAGNTSDGVHIAATGGVWMALVFGFGGVHDHAGELSFAPHLPPGWNSLEFSLHFKHRQIGVELSHQTERYRLDDGDALRDHDPRGSGCKLVAGEPLELPVPSC